MQTNRDACRRGDAPVVVLLILLLGQGCGGPPPPPAPSPPAVPEDGIYCPLPQVFDGPAERPRYLRIENRTDQALAVFYDWCFRHSRMADVPPGKLRQVPFREHGDIITYPEGLRFHAYRMDTGDRFGIFSVPMEPGVLRLVLAEEERAVDSLLTRYRLEEGEGVSEGDFAVFVTDDAAYAATVADPSMAILTWSCVDGETALSLGLPRKLPEGEPVVEARVDEGEWEDVEGWVAHRMGGAGNDALSLRGPTVRTLTEGARSGDLLDLVVRAGEAATVHRFRVRSLDEALAALPCALPAGAAASPD